MCWARMCGKREGRVGQRLTAARGIARPAEIAVHLYVSLRAPDGVAVSIVPVAGAVGY